MADHGNKTVVIQPSSAGLGLVKTVKTKEALESMQPTTRSMARRNIQGGPRFAK